MNQTSSRPSIIGHTGKFLSARDLPRARGLSARMRPWALAVLAWAALQTAHAAEIVVGQVAPLSGTQSTQAREYAAGMQALFNSINKAGGANGHTFRLVTRDDKGNAADTLKMTRELIDAHQPVVLAGYFGGPAIAAVVDAGILGNERISIVGYRSEDVRGETPQLFNVRASLQDEISKMAEHLATVGVTQLGLLYEGGPDAIAYVAAIQDLARRGGGTIVSRAPYDPETAKVGDAVNVFLRTKPQAIIMISSAPASANFIEQYRAAGGAAQLFVYSGADMERVMKKMAENRVGASASAVKGVAVAQVVPSPYQNSKLSKELHDALASLGTSDLRPSYVMLEGFIAAKVIVEAVRRQGRRITREGTTAALEGIENVDLGGHVIGYKNGTRNGSRYVELTIISDTGKIRH